MNNQPIEKQDLAADGWLEVHSIFLTIQGEGPFVGRRAIFIRLAGCNLQCPMCDTDYTSKRVLYSPDDLLAHIKKIRRPGQLLVITGGEPFRQNLGPATDLLLNAGYDIQIETNGTLYQPLQYDRITVVCSPKTGKLSKDLEPHVAAFKYVLHASSVGDDGLPLQALGHPAKPFLARPRPENKAPIYLQPVDEVNPRANAAHLSKVIDSVMHHDYTLGLQIHKIISME